MKQTYTVAADNWNESQAKKFDDKQKAFRFARKVAKEQNVWVVVVDDLYFMMRAIESWRFAPDGKMYRSRRRCEQPK